MAQARSCRPAVVDWYVLDPHQIFAELTPGLTEQASLSLPRRDAYWGPMDIALQSVLGGTATPSEVRDQVHDSVVQVDRDMGFDGSNVFSSIVLRK